MKVTEVNSKQINRIQKQEEKQHKYSNKIKFKVWSWIIRIFNNNLLKRMATSLSCNKISRIFNQGQDFSCLGISHLRIRVLMTWINWLWALLVRSSPINQKMAASLPESVVQVGLLSQRLLLWDLTVRRGKWESILGVVVRIYLKPRLTIPKAYRRL